MRKLIVSNLLSLDGFYAGPGGDVMVLPFDDPFSDYNAELLRAADTLLLGRLTFEGFRGYWPSIADDEAQPDVEREISRLNNAIDKVVVSDTLSEADVAPWTNTRIVRRADAHHAIAELKRADGGHILTFGSHVLWTDLLQARLVDELHLMIGAALLGDGVPIFSGPRTPLRLLDAQVLHGSQLILARYAAGDTPA